MPAWEDLNARARGLGSALLGRARLEPLAYLPDAAAVARELRRTEAYAPLLSPEASTPESLDRASRRAAAARLAVLARRAGPRCRALRVVFEDEDRRSLRALLRGAAAGAAPEDRLAGLVPTPALPEGALRELADQASPGAVAALLVAWGHAYGSPLLSEAADARPGLFRMELALDRTFARRAVKAARRAGAEIRAYVQWILDLENLEAALVIAAGELVGDPGEAFLEGGRRLDRKTFLEAARASTPGEARRILSGALKGAAPGGSPLPGRRAWLGPLEEGAGGSLLVSGLRTLIDALRSRARLAPLGPAPTLLFAARVRGEVVDLRGIAWGTALGVPGGKLAAGLVSP